MKVCFDWPPSPITTGKDKQPGKTATLMQLQKYTPDMPSDMPSNAFLNSDFRGDETSKKAVQSKGIA